MLEAYEQLIASARHYVYLETPCLVSGLRGDTAVGNRIAEVRWREGLMVGSSDVGVVDVHVSLLH